MAIGFFRWLMGDRTEKATIGQPRDVACRALVDAATDYQLRCLCWMACENLVANAIGRADFRTFRGGKEFQGREAWLWNVEPNANQSSTVFLHEMIHKLYTYNEVLMIPTRRRDGTTGIVLADSWSEGRKYPNKLREYHSVRVGDLDYDKTFRENEVLHLKLNTVHMKPVFDALYHSYWRLVDAAMQQYQWDKGQHWKVHVSQMASAAEDFTQKFTQMIEDQAKVFLQSNGAILPEFDGYAYTNESRNGGSDTRDLKAMIDDIYTFTARGFQIPAVMVNGSVESMADAQNRFLTYVCDPICDQLQEEILRKRYSFEEVSAGDYLRIDTSSIIHFDLFAAAASVEKLIGSAAFTINDVRRAAGQPEINEPWANEHYLTKNISRIGETAQALEQKGGS